MGFWGSLGKVGKFIVNPKNIGTAAGFALGGPAGAAAGRTLGGIVDGGDLNLGTVAGDALGGYGMGAGIGAAGGMFASQGGAAAAQAAAPSLANTVASSAPAAAASVAPAATAGMTALEKAFLVSQMAGTAGGVYGNLKEGRRRDRQSRAGGNVFGRMLSDNMRGGY